MSLLKKFQKTASVTRNLLKLVAGKEYAVRFTSDMHLGKEMPAKLEVDEVSGEVKKVAKQPAFVAFVDNLDVPEDNEDGYEEMQTIISTVMRKELEALYPNQSYVGKCFVFSQVKVERGYNVPQITEVADPDPARAAKVLVDWKAEQAKKAATPVTTDAASASETSTATETAQADTGKGKAKK